MTDILLGIICIQLFIITIDIEDFKKIIVEMYKRRIRRK